MKELSIFVDESGDFGDKGSGWIFELNLNQYEIDITGKSMEPYFMSLLVC